MVCTNRFRETIQASGSTIHEDLKNFEYPPDSIEEKSHFLKKDLGQNVMRNWPIKTARQSAQLRFLRSMLPVPLSSAPNHATNRPVQGHPIDDLPSNPRQPIGSVSDFF
jgi:hypothetical protein